MDGPRLDMREGYGMLQKLQKLRSDPESRVGGHLSSQAHPHDSTPRCNAAL